MTHGYYPQEGPFWDEDCPARGATLQHMHDRDDVDVRQNICSFCLTSMKWRPGPPFGQAQVVPVPPGLDIPERLKEVMATVDPDDVPIEPKMVDGTGPKGAVYGPGRGELTARQKGRLDFVAWRERREGKQP